MVARSASAGAALGLAVVLLVGGCGREEASDIGEPLTSDSTTTSGGAAETSAPSGPTTAAGPPSSTAPDRAIEVVVKGGVAEGGVRREAVRVGETVTIRITSDTADEVHVHTYDETVRLEPGVPAEVTFVANIPGVFEVELHKRGREILKLEVRA